MPKNIIQYDLLISCPGDITNEINIIEDSVLQFNSQFSDALGISIRTKHWQKNSYPQSGGKPQALLNEQFVNECDAAVAVLWTRFGTPTDKYGSGTEEEIEIMLSSGKQVFVYFSDKPIPPSHMNEEEYKKVKAFRDKYKDRGIYFSYSSDEEFKSLFFAHLSQHFLSEKKVAEVKEERHSELKVIGIDQNKHVNDYAPIIKFVPNAEMTKNKYLDKIQNLYSVISSMKVGKRIELTDSMPRMTLSFDKPLEIGEDDREIIHAVAKKLNITVPEDFFALGNLVQNSMSSLVGGGYITGTSAEKDKYHTIQELLEVISNALEWIPVENAFADKKCLMFALQNCGTDIDEDVEISLRFPKKSLLPINEFPKFNNDKMGYLLNDCDMSDLFGIRSTSVYSDYDSSIVTSKRFSPNISTPSIFPGYTPDYNDDFERELSDVFCYSCFEEGEDYIVKLKIDYIKHNTTIAFPTIIFIKEQCGSIPYQITSKNSPEVVSGEIKITDDIQNH